jgi:hypothetical protein
MNNGRHIGDLYPGSSGSSRFHPGKVRERNSAFFTLPFVPFLPNFPAFLASKLPARQLAEQIQHVRESYDENA